MLVPYTRPYHWAQGVIDGAMVILVEVETDAGLTGYGESIGTPSAEGIQSYINLAGAICIDRSPFDNAQLMAEAYHGLFQALLMNDLPTRGRSHYYHWVEIVIPVSGLIAHSLVRS